MKTLLAAHALFLVASCTTLQSTTRSTLVGEWRYADDTKACHYVFNPDGSFRGEVTYRRKMISKFTGRWSVEGDTLLYRYISDSFERIPAGAVDRDKLLAVEMDSFTIEAADGSKRTYARIR